MATNVESLLVRKLRIRFIDARTIATEAKLNLGLSGYISNEQDVQRVFDESIKIFHESCTKNDQHVMHALKNSLDNIKFKTSSSSDDSTGRRSSNPTTTTRRSRSSSIASASSSSGTVSSNEGDIHKTSPTCDDDDITYSTTTDDTSSLSSTKRSSSNGSNNNGINMRGMLTKRFSFGSKNKKNKKRSSSKLCRRKARRNTSASEPIHQSKGTVAPAAA